MSGYDTDVNLDQDVDFVDDLEMMTETEPEDFDDEITISSAGWGPTEDHGLFTSINDI